MNTTNLEIERVQNLFSNKKSIQLKPLEMVQGNSSGPGSSVLTANGSALTPTSSPQKEPNTSTRFTLELNTTTTPTMSIPHQSRGTCFSTTTPTICPTGITTG